jgi:hypothetical protein
MPRTGTPPSRAASARLGREDTIRALRAALDAGRSPSRGALESALAHLQVGLGSGRRPTVPDEIVRAIRAADRGQSTRALRAEILAGYGRARTPSESHVDRIRRRRSRAEVPDTPVPAADGGNGSAPA